MEEEEYKYTRRRVNFYLNEEIESGYQHLLQLHGIEPSVENVRALARYHALQWHSVTQQEVSECFPIRGIMQYQKSINEILRLRNEVKAIRERETEALVEYRVSHGLCRQCGLSMDSRDEAGDCAGCGL